MATILGRELPSSAAVAESWEIAAHPDGTTSVDNGPLAGNRLDDLLDEYGLALIGNRSLWALKRGKFPLLIKLLDAAHHLSVQVHPDDTYALANEGNELGKTEMWVILHAEPGAEIILGVADGTTPEAFREGIEKGNLEQLLHRIKVKAGDHINVPAGSLHAILGGLLIAEIQQNSNTTYRVYDWNRVDSAGNPREVHIGKALDVINFNQVEPPVSSVLHRQEKNGVFVERLDQNSYFTVERHTTKVGSIISGNCSGETFEIWGVISGHALVEAENGNENLSAITWSLFPAVMGAYTIKTPFESICLRVYAS